MTFLKVAISHEVEFYMCTRAHFTGWKACGGITRHVAFGMLSLGRHVKASSVEPEKAWVDR